MRIASPVLSTSYTLAWCVRMPVSSSKQSDDEVNITLMTIYDKSDIENVSDAYLRILVQQIESPKK